MFKCQMRFTKNDGQYRYTLRKLSVILFSKLISCDISEIISCSISELSHKYSLKAYNVISLRLYHVVYK